MYPKDILHDPLGLYFELVLLETLLGVFCLEYCFLFLVFASKDFCPCFHLEASGGVLRHKGL